MALRPRQVSLLVERLFVGWTFCVVSDVGVICIQKHAEKLATALVFTLAEHFTIYRIARITKCFLSE